MPMWDVVTDQRKIRMVRNKLIDRMSSFVTDEVSTRITTRGGTVEATALWSDHLQMWWYWDEGPTQYWHPFHVQKPNSTTSVLVEINFPIQGYNPRIGGAVLRDSQSKEYIIAHSGRIGGGRPGIGQSLVRQRMGDWFNLVALTPRGEERRYMPVALIEASNAPQQLAAFIHAIHQVKHSVEPQDPNQHQFLGYRPFQLEFDGDATYRRRALITARYNHGAVVNELAATLSALGMSVHNDHPRDLFVVERDAMSVLFEVKTDVSSQTIYTAVGQLLLNSDPVHRPVLCLVIPTSTQRSHIARLRTLGIHVVEYSINPRGSVAFSGLDRVLPGKNRRATQKQTR